MNSFRSLTLVHCYCWLWALLVPCVRAEGDAPLIPLAADYYESDGNGRYHLKGHVEIVVPELLTLNCDDLVALSPASGPDTTNVVMTATGDVRMRINKPAKGTNAPVDVTAFAGQAVYTGTNALLVLTRKPKVVSTQGTLTAETIYYDVTTGRSWAQHFQFVPNPKSFKLLDRFGKAGSNSAASPK